MLRQNQVFASDSRILVAVANLTVRRALSDACRQRGASAVSEASNQLTLRRMLQSSVIDLLVADDNLSELFTSDLVRDVRRGDLHEHPFPVIIVLAHRQEERQLRILIDSGPDAVVLVPVSVASLTEKIDLLTANRKPFVVSHDYIGPNRRTTQRAGAAPPLMVEVPNPLAAGADRGAFQVALDRAKANLKSKTTECALGQIAWAMKSGLPSDPRQLIPLVENLASNAISPSIRVAAAGLAGALRAEVKSDIIGWSRKLMEVTQGMGS